MNTNTNPSQSTEEKLLSTVEAAKNRSFVRDADLPYVTPAGAEHRTFEVQPRSSYERWLLMTITVGVVERSWLNSYCHLVPLRLKLTFREGTLEQPELNWFFERVMYVPTQASDAIQHCAAEQPMQRRPLRWEVLSVLANDAHTYLAMFDVIAMVKDLAPVMDRAHFNVAALNIPSPNDDLNAFEQHMRILRDCLALAYADDSYLR
ncbi:MAG: hypothetical protein AB7O64_06890 [Methylibium sp.]